MMFLWLVLFILFLIDCSFPIKYFHKDKIQFVEIKIKNEDSLKNKKRRTKGKNIIFQ
jgi:hypothetical protein